MITAAQEASPAVWSPNFAAYGLTTIVWGTEGIFSGYIVNLYINTAGMILLLVICTKLVTHFKDID